MTINIDGQTFHCFDIGNDQIQVYDGTEVIRDPIKYSYTLVRDGAHFILHLQPDVPKEHVKAAKRLLRIEQDVLSIATSRHQP